eukprot:scaffold134672_cov30-Tisochrysis_lutea.AAC.1
MDRRKRPPGDEVERGRPHPRPCLEAPVAFGRQPSLLVLRKGRDPVVKRPRRAALGPRYSYAVRNPVEDATGCSDLSPLGDALAHSSGVRARR